MFPVEPSGLSMLLFFVSIKLPFEFLTIAVVGCWVALLMNDLFGSVLPRIWADYKSVDFLVPETSLLGLNSVISC